MQLKLPKLQAEGREKQDIKATVTVAMAVVTFYACYLPAITYSVWRSKTKYFAKHVWVSFLVAFCTFISSASNPIIYVLRNKRYREAIRQLVKDPFRSSSFQEKPVKNNRERREVQSMCRSWGKAKNQEYPPYVKKLIEASEMDILRQVKWSGLTK